MLAPSEPEFESESESELSATYDVLRRLLGRAALSVLAGLAVFGEDAVVLVRDGVLELVRGGVWAEGGAVWSAPEVLLFSPDGALDRVPYHRGLARVRVDGVYVSERAFVRVQRGVGAVGQ